MVGGYPWFCVVQGTELEQGDYLLDCPFYQAEVDGTFTRHGRDCIVLSHSCDLANDKLTTVQVCPFWPLEQMAENSPILKSTKGKEEMRKGNMSGYHLINRCQIEGHELDFVVIDFRTLFWIPLDLARQLAIAQSPRLRLLPPYREHLAQAFARFFMRVGLPIDVPRFQS